MGELLAWLFVGAALFAIIQAIWLPALILLCAVIAAYVGLKIVARVEAKQQAEQANVAAVRERADREHAAIMRGDLAAGTYGQYPVPDVCRPWWEKGTVPQPASYANRTHYAKHPPITPVTNTSLEQVFYDS